MRLEQIEIRLEPHAYERYCQRVEPVSRAALEQRIRDKITSIVIRKNGFLLIDDVWWRGQRSVDCLTLHTCYGRTPIDLPAAIDWAKRNKDRIALGEDHAD